jgi:hypothetical protein
MRGLGLLATKEVVQVLGGDGSLFAKEEESLLGALENAPERTVVSVPSHTMLLPR